MSYKVDSSKITISIKTGTTRDLVVAWGGTKEISHTKAFNVVSQIWANGVWMDGPSANTTETPKAKWSDLVKTVELANIDGSASKVRVRVKPIADTYKNDNSDKNYYEGEWSDWSNVFSGWTKTTKPPAFKIESDTKKNKKDTFEITIQESASQDRDLVGTFDLKKSRMEKFLTYLAGFEFKWFAWNGSEWTSVNAYDTYIKYNNAANPATQPGSGRVIDNATQIVVSDQVKSAIRGGSATVRFLSWVHPNQNYLSYKLQVTPVPDNEFVFDPIESSVSKKYKAADFKFNANDISIVFDKDEDQFEVSWKTDDFDKFSSTVNHVQGFLVHWQYLKPICSIWNNAGGGKYDPDGGKYRDGNSQEGEEVGIDSYTAGKETRSYEVPTTTKTWVPNSYRPNDIYGGIDESGRYNPYLYGNPPIPYGGGGRYVESTVITTKEITVNVRKWKFNFQLPDGVRRNNPVRIQIKIHGDGNQSWNEVWSNWFNFTNEVDEVSVDMAMIRRPQVSSRNLDVLWTMGSKKNVLYTSGFSYQWYYMGKTDTQWRDGQSGTVDITRPIDGQTEATTIAEACKAYNKGSRKHGVDINAANITYTQAQLEWYLANPQYLSDRTKPENERTLPGLYVWGASYDAPAEATSVMCTITPNPASDGYYIGKPLILTFEITTPTLYIDRNTVNIRVQDAEQRSIFAVWDNITTVGGVDYSDYISGYECKWQYYWLDNWFDSTGNVAYSKMNIGPVSSSEDSVEYLKPLTSFSIPDYREISEVRLSVRPTPTNDTIFKGVWCDWVRFSVYPKPLVITNVEEYLDLEPLETEGNDRTLVGVFSDSSGLPDDAWPIGTRIEDKKILFEWSYELGGIWMIDGDAKSVRLDYANDTFDIPTDATAVRLRVMVDVDNLKYIGEWSEYVTYEVSRDEYKITDVDLELLEGSRNTVFATWSATDLPEGKTVEKYIDTFSIEWRYFFSGRYWDPDNQSDVPSSNVPTDLVSVYSPSQDQATAVSFRIKANPKRSIDFVSAWSDFFPLDLPLDNIPDEPSNPDVTLLNDGYTMIVTTDISDYRTMYVEFQVHNITDDTYDNSGLIDAFWATNTASWQYTGVGGKQYQFRVRALNEDKEYKTPELGDHTTNPQGYSGWSQTVGTKPAPVKLIYAKGLSSNEIEIAWEGGVSFGNIDEDTDYIIERTQKRYYFDTSSNVDSESVPALGEGGQTRRYGGASSPLPSGSWYFRVAVKRRNSDLQSDWSNIADCTIGKPPTAPTTWSNRTVAMIGDTLYLYWTHNSEDNSDETEAMVWLNVNGTVITPEPIPRESDNTRQRFYEVPSEYCANEGTIQWQVKTKGAYDEYSPWSTLRIIKIYSAPSLSMTLFGSSSYLWDEYIEEHASTNGVYDYTIPGTSVLSSNVLTNFPLFVRFSATPISQEPIAYSVSIIANNTYEMTDSSGRSIYISAGTTVFRRYYNTSAHQFTAMIMPGDAVLENGISYTINATVAMSSGLSAEASIIFATSFSVDSYNLNASIGYDRTKYVAYIKPYCVDDNDTRIDTVVLSVHRRMFDGSLVKIADGIPGNLTPVITDPHPSLDYARYRVVAIDRTNGHVQFADLPPHPIHGTSIIIQWDEKWSGYFEVNSELALSERPWTGSMIKLPYNIDTTDSNTVDVEMVEYIGRDHPVSYYGTQVGQKATWNALIPIADKQTIYDLRRLARYMGNAYVREPSGTGYWAHVEVSFNLTHLETTVPVSLSITRVEGGM